MHIKLMTIRKFMKYNTNNIRKEIQSNRFNKEHENNNQIVVQGN